MSWRRPRPTAAVRSRKGTSHTIGLSMSSIVSGRSIDESAVCSVPSLPSGALPPDARSEVITLGMWRLGADVSTPESQPTRKTRVAAATRSMMRTKTKARRSDVGFAVCIDEKKIACESFTAASRKTSRLACTMPRMTWRTIAAEIGVDERDEALQVDRAHLRPADVLGDQPLVRQRHQRERHRDHRRRRRRRTRRRAACCAPSAPSSAASPSSRSRPR